MQTLYRFTSNSFGAYIIYIVGRHIDIWGSNILPPDFPPIVQLLIQIGCDIDREPKIYSSNAWATNFNTER